MFSINLLLFSDIFADRRMSCTSVEWKEKLTIQCRHCLKTVNMCRQNLSPTNPSHQWNVMQEMSAHRTKPVCNMWNLIALFMFLRFCCLEKKNFVVIMHSLIKFWSLFVEFSCRCFCLHHVPSSSWLRPYWPSVVDADHQWALFLCSHWQCESSFELFHICIHRNSTSLAACGQHCSSQCCWKWLSETTVMTEA